MTSRPSCGPAPAVAGSSRTERGLARADEPDGIPAPWIELWDDPAIRMNEGGVDSQGRLWCGSMGYDRVPGTASLQRVDADGHVVTVLPDVTISNGIDLSPDHRLAYYNDTPTGRTDVFDVEDGELTGRRPFVHHDVGHPDGLTVDSAGNVWVALNGAGRVRCYSPTAEVLAEIELPVRLVTACTLGGDDGRDLFVTTSRENLDDPEPEAGAVFRTRVDVCRPAGAGLRWLRPGRPRVAPLSGAPCKPRAPDPARCGRRPCRAQPGAVGS